MSAPPPALPLYRSFSTSLGVHGQTGGYFPTQPVRPIPAEARAELETRLGPTRQALLDQLCEEALSIGAQWIIDRSFFPSKEQVKSAKGVVDTIGEMLVPLTHERGGDLRKCEDPATAWTDKCLGLLFSSVSQADWNEVSQRVNSAQEFIAHTLKEIQTPTPNEAFLDKLIDSWEMDRIIGSITYPGRRASKEANDAPSPTYLFYCLLIESVELSAPVSLFNAERRPEPGWRDFVDTFIDRELWSRTLERRAKHRTRTNMGDSKRPPVPLRDGQPNE